MTKLIVSKEIDLLSAEELRLAFMFLFATSEVSQDRALNCIQGAKDVMKNIRIKL